jgi:hypothetical protein
MSGRGLHGQSADRHGRRGWAAAAAALVVVLGFGVFVLVGSRSVPSDHLSAPSDHLRAPSTQRSSPARQAAATGHASDHVVVAPNGTFFTASGTTATISSLRPKPTMVWFVAGGCASCAASIPAVAAHFDQLRAAGFRVLTLGLYGDFPPGRAGVAQLLSFGKLSAGLDRQSINHPGWEWGMASKSLSLAYDPSGLPDLYVLIGPAGHIRYRNSVPDSTMRELRAAAEQWGSRASVPR